MTMKLKDLGITRRERDALEAVAAGLESGKFKHRSAGENDGSPNFDIGYTAMRYDCGTVACIGGWVSLKMQGCEFTADIEKAALDNASVYVEAAQEKPIAALYWPMSYIDADAADAFEAAGGSNAVTPPVAAAAIRQFLDTGTVDYPALIRKHGGK